MSCIFCRIAAGEVAAEVVHRDERVTVFRDLAPQAPTHLLVVPNEHVESLATLDDAALAAELLAACAAAGSQLGGGYRVVTNVGPDSGQSVDHLHFHVLGGRLMGWPPG
jgi:histidine triad (HIT) family protein